MKAIRIVTVAAVLAVGCTSRLGDLTVASTQNIRVATYDPTSMTPTEAHGSDCKALIFGFPTGAPNLETAIDAALEEGGGNLITDVVLTSKVWSALVYGETCVRAEGKVWSVQIANLDTLDSNSVAAIKPRVGIVLEDGEHMVARVVAVTKEKIGITSGMARIKWLERSNVLSLRLEQDRH